MRTRLTSIAPLGVALLLTSTLGCFKPKWGTASPDPNILTIGAATYSSDADVSEGVFEKCEPHLEVAEEIATRAKVPAVLANDPSGGGKVLQLQITSIFAPKGGRYSGPKQIVLHGEIIEGGGVTASFDVRRSTMRSVGTCKMLDHVNKAISKDVRKWLKKPTMGAQLGELK